PGGGDRLGRPTHRNPSRRRGQDQPLRRGGLRSGEGPARKLREGERARRHDPSRIPVQPERRQRRDRPRRRPGRTPDRNVFTDAAAGGDEVGDWSRSMAIPLIATLVAALLAPESAPSKTCSLLTDAQIEASTGAKTDRREPGEMKLPNDGGTMQMCTWALRSQKAQIMISTAAMPPGANVQTFAKKNPGLDALRAQKWTEESKDFGNAWCA